MSWRLQCQWLYSFLISIFMSTNSATSQATVEAPRASITGNVTLGGLFPLHYPGETGPCSVFNSLRAIQEIEALLFSIDQINANETLLPNITLGVKAFDTCGDATSALNSAVKEFVLGTKWNSDELCAEHEKPVIGVIGPAYSYEAEHITPFLNLFEIPIISYSATSPKLSNKDKYEYFSRTATSDEYQIPAIIDLLVQFNWTYVSILYTDETYGIGGYNGLKEEAEKKGIYFANKISVPQKYDVVKFTEVVDEIFSTPKATVIILFGVESAMEPILYMIQERAGNKTVQFVCSDAIASAINEEFNKVQRITQQTFFFNLPTSRVEGFTKYFLNLSVEGNQRNPWFKDFFEMFMNCTFDNPGHKSLSNDKPSCYANQTLSSTNYSTKVEEFTQSVPLVVDAVYAFAHALHHFIETCQKNKSQSCMPLDKIPGEQLLNVLRKQVFRSPSGSLVNFTKSGDVMGVYDIFYNGKVGGKRYEYFKVGQWRGRAQNLHFSESEWAKKFSPIKSTCETVCGVNQYRKSSKKPWHCWECKNCMAGSYVVNDTECHKCPKGEKPDIARKICVEIIPVYLTTDGKVVSVYLVVLPMILASIGLVAVFFVFGIFVKYWNTPLVKASGRELSSLLLLGILLAFLFPFVAISKPSPLKCFWQFVLGSLPFTICFVAIAVKNNRTYRIFNPNRVITAQPSMIRPKSQILVSLGLITFQLILLSALMLLNFPRDELIYSDFETINYVCITSDEQVLLSHLYNVVLLIACTYYGYKTKNIPRNFNEAKHIAFAMYGLCVSMIAFGGVVFLLNSQFTNDYGVVVEMMHNNLVGIIILVCFFAPKVYIILYKPQENANNVIMATTSIIGVETDVVKTTREHRRSHSQFPTNKIGVAEFNVRKVESANTHTIEAKIENKSEN